MSFKEVDIVYVTQSVKADIYDYKSKGRTITIPQGAQGTIVGINGPEVAPSSYIVEFPLAEPEATALATVSPTYLAAV